MQYLPYILALITLLFLAIQIIPYFVLRSKRGKTAPSLDALLNSEQRKQSQTLLYFMAPHCGMCRRSTPIIDELAKQRLDVLRVDISNHPEVAKELGVMGTPAYVFIKSGIIDSVKLGALDKKKILKILEGKK